jgi:hypothetical protein
MDHGNTGLAFIVGGLAVIVVLFFMFGGLNMFRGGGGDGDIDVSVQGPSSTPAE